MRFVSTATPGVVVLRLEHGKANAIGHDFLVTLSALLDQLAVTPPRALVITGHGAFFSAGLDLPALIDVDRATMAGFMDDFERVMQRIFTAPFPVVAAINGHAIAGGCVLALQADVRLAAAVDGARIGLNEVVIGLGLPPHVLESLRAQVPATSLVPLALEGRLVSPTDAAGLGLVSEVVPADVLEVRAVARAAELAVGSPIAFAQIKAALRAPALSAAVGARTEAERWLDTWFSDAGRAAVTAAVARLRAPKA